MTIEIEQIPTRAATNSTNVARSINVNGVSDPYNLVTLPSNDHYKNPKIRAANSTNIARAVNRVSDPNDNLGLEV